MSDVGGDVPPAPAKPRRIKVRRRGSDPGLTHRTAVMVALISIGGVILGGLLTVVSGYFLASYNADSEARRSREDYLRTQRQVAYAALITDAQLLRGAQEVVSRQGATISAAAPTFRPTQVEWEDYKAKLDKLQLDVSNVFIIGTKDVVDTSESFQTAAVEIDADLEVLTGKLIDTRRSGSAAFASFVTGRGGEERLLSTLRVQAHEDLAGSF